MNAKISKIFLVTLTVLMMGTGFHMVYSAGLEDDGLPEATPTPSTEWNETRPDQDQFEKRDKKPQTGRIESDQQTPPAEEIRRPNLNPSDDRTGQRSANP